MRKKGSARDVVLIAVLITIFAFGFFIIHFIASTAVTELTKNPQINASQPTVTALEAVTNKVIPRLDYSILIIFIGLILALMITGWFVAGYPIFAFIYFIVIVLTVIFSAVFSNLWETIVNKAAFGTTILSFPITNNIMAYLPFYMAVIGILGLIIMFAKPHISGE